MEEEKRARRGVLGDVKCGADESVEAFGDGVNVPLRRRPLACAGLDDQKLFWLMRSIEASNQPGR